MTLRKIILICLTCISCVAYAQWETIIVGNITNADTGEPIANANIYFRNTSIGTTSNEAGDFMLRCVQDKKRTLVVSSVGYHTQRYSIEPGQMAGIEIAMKEKQAILPEVIATPGENPAISIVNKVRENRKHNDCSLSDSRSQILKANTNIYISHIGRRQLRHSLWRSLQGGMIEQSDSTMLLPLFVREQEVEIVGNRISALNTTREQALVLSPTDYSALLSVDGNISVYQNNISLMGNSFLSPLAASGPTAYNYFLTDSIQTEEGNLYIIRFHPKNAFYATLDGEMHIDSATYGLRYISARVSPQANVNYISDVKFTQLFGADNMLQDETLSALFDFAVTIDTTQRIMPTALVEYHLHNENGAAYGASSLTVESVESISRLDSLDTPAIRVATWLGKIITTGYIPTGTVFDFGHIEEILQINDHELVHIGLPMRTNERLLKNVCFEANVAYGIRDKQWKGMGRVSFNLPTLRRNILHIEYRDHYAWAEVDDFTRLHHENAMGYGLMDFTAYAFEALHSNSYTKNTAIRRRQFEIRTENDWHNNVETMLYARIGWQSFSYQSLGGIVRVGFGERKTDLWFKRYHSRTPYPIIFAGLEGGSYSLTGSDSYRLYGKITLMVKHIVPLGLGGELTYALQTGCILGNVPFLLLHHFEGNQGYTYDPYRFTLMNNFQYASNLYMSLHTEWNGRGILFNLIPGVRYAKLRELVTFKMGWGTKGLSTPYVEVGCGIGNILRVLDIHSVWRVTHRNQTETPLWAMRFRLHIGY